MIDFTIELQTSEADLASIGGLIGEPARATMLSALMTGLALPASELAELAGISPQTASSHLQKLLEGKLLDVERNGRHRYYRLYNSNVAMALESLMLLAPIRSKTQRLPKKELCYARSCYDHLAGSLGVLLCQAMLEQNWIILQERTFSCTSIGQERLKPLGIETTTSLACLDWTERRHHLGGRLGRTLLKYFLTHGWMVRLPSSRALRLTEKGRLGLSGTFGLDLQKM